MLDFVGYPKIPRLFRDIIVTEKIEGTNGQIFIERVTVLDELEEDGVYYSSDNGEDILLKCGDEYWCIKAGSRKRWLSPGSDNFGFFEWVYHNAEELLKLGPGRHFGEWWGKGIQRGYGLNERKFSLFDVDKELETSIVDKVPVLYRGMFDHDEIVRCKYNLIKYGSHAAPGFMDPEGVIVYHTAAKQYFKSTIKDDLMHKSEKT